MKKSLVVLLIAVLALSAVFAAPTYSGSVTATASYNIDKYTFNFENVNKLVAEFKFEDTLKVAKAGSSMPYADLAASVKLTADPEGTTVKFDAFTLDTFKVVGDGWNLDFLAKTGAIDYAVSEIDTAEYEDPLKPFAKPVEYPYTIAWGFEKNAVAYTNDNLGTIRLYAIKEAEKAEKTVFLYGVKQVWDGEAWVYDVDTTKYTTVTSSEIPADSTFTYAKNAPTSNKNTYTTTSDGLYKVTSAQKKADWYNKVAIPAHTDFIVEAESKVFDITDNLSAQIGAGFAYSYTSETNATPTYSYGVSGAFTYNDVASLAFDWAGITDYDLAANLKLGFVELSSYYASYGNYIVDSVSTTTTDNPWLSAKAVATLEDLKTVVTITGKDLFFGENEFDIEAVNTAVEGYTFTAAAKGLASDETTKTSFAFGAEADYADAGLALKGDVAFGYDFMPVFGFGVDYEADDFAISAELTYAYTTNCNIAPDFKSTLKLSAELEGDLFKTTGAILYNTKANAGAGTTTDWDAVDSGWYVTAGVSSDKLVDGATFNIDYTSGELLTTTPKFGKVEATLKVSL